MKTSICQRSPTTSSSSKKILESLKAGKRGAKSLGFGFWFIWFISSKEVVQVGNYKPIWLLDKIRKVLDHSGVFSWDKRSLVSLPAHG